ncbi:NAD(P)-dependent oxidoreductase [Bacillus sp. FJAT-47783]|uniref:NAD-dependent epimerase/dehydratase family protein n=1 Tax=Bacillus sp. FJAT-47783 TaxID=2922712 RepID=UPI001FADAF1F|nr:NAD(P)-dependent oxidoreductase [Bacillus sp. FJAT-47783]
MNRVLIVGVQQFIGFHLCSRFLEEGCSVDGVFIKPDHPFYHKWVEEQMLWLGRNAQFNIFTKKDLELGEYDRIYFCQLDPHDPEWPKEWEKEKGVLEDLLEMAKKAECPVVFLSSFDVYGDDQIDITDQDEPFPKKEKGRLFIQAENWWQKQAENAYVPTIIVRVPTVFGPWQPPGQWITDQLLLELQFNPIVFTKKIHEKTPVRDLLYIEEVINCLVEIGREEARNPSIVHLTSKGNLLNLPSSFTFPVKPIHIQTKNCIIIQSEEKFEDRINEQRIFMNRFNPYLQNMNK